MADEMKLDLGRIRQLESQLSDKFNISVEAVGLDGTPLTRKDGQERCPNEPLCAIVAKDPAACKCCQAERQRAIQRAVDLREPYIFRCGTGLEVTCATISSGGRQVAAVFAGKTLPNLPRDEIAKDIRGRLSPFEMNQDEVANAINRQKMSPDGVLVEAASFISRWDHASPPLLTDQTESNEAVLEKQVIDDIQKRPTIAADRVSPCLAPMEERELVEKMMRGDRAGAKKILKTFVGRVLFSEPLGSRVLKSRLIEFMAILSRIAAENGVCVNALLERNFIYYSTILNSENDIDLSITISKAIKDYLDICINHACRQENPVETVLRYIELNYMKPDLSVDELAKQAHLSSSRISHVFKKKLNTTLMETLIRTRLEHAKLLLLQTSLHCTEIASRVGFNDQSYFTRVFHAHEKITPIQFRTLHRNHPVNSHQSRGVAG